MVEVHKITVTTTGSNGSATGTGYSTRAVNGEVRALRVDWGATAPASSDIDVVVESDDNRPEVVLFSKDDSATDAWVYPKVQSTGTDGNAISGEYQHPLANGRLKVSVAGCNALTTAVTVYAFVVR